MIHQGEGKKNPQSFNIFRFFFTGEPCATANTVQALCDVDHDFSLQKITKIQTLLNELEVRTSGIYPYVRGGQVD